MSDLPAPVLIVSGPSGAGKTTVGRLVAAAFDPSVHIRIDDFMRFVATGWVEPWLPESAHQNHVLGGAVAAAALQFAEGGYTVVVDGYIFPDALDGLRHWSERRGVPLHYAVLRTDLATCMTRAGLRNPDEPENHDSFALLHARFAELGEHEANVVEADGTPAVVAETLLGAFTSGRLRVAASS